MKIVREGEPRQRILDGPVVSVAPRSAGIVVVIDSSMYADRVAMRAGLPDPMFIGRHELLLRALDARDLAHAILRALPPELRAEDSP